MARRRADIEDAAPVRVAALYWMNQGDGTVLFDDQIGGADSSGRSLVMTAPRVRLVERDGGFVERPSGQVVDDPIDWIRRHHRPCDGAEQMPFAGGVAGFLGFEFGWELDRLTVPGRRWPGPDLWVGVFDAGAVYDHGAGTWSVAGRNREAVDAMVASIREVPADTEVASGGRGRRRTGRDVEGPRYRQGVGAAVEAICAGELFEVSYTERFHAGWDGSAAQLYAGLCANAPGGYGGVVDARDVSVLSISPEQFLEVEADGRVVTRPIKGTRPRGESAREDRRLARELAASDKDRAENVMIVDLMRNDLTRVCRPGSVEATALCELHSFESVHHLVSTVEGRLAEPFDALDAFVSAFPAGSITGAPKLRAMEWIADHEQSPRGPYTGSMFYWSDHGRLDSNVLIRTAVVEGQQAQYGAGGAVVSDSEPAGEYEEALWKARPFFDLLEDS